MRSRRAILPLLLVLAAAPASAQQASIDVEAMRQILLNGVEQNRLMDLDYLEAMPASALRFAPTEGVRDFAQQLYHISEAFVLVLQTSGVAVAPPPAVVDSATLLNDVPTLEAAISAYYDWVRQSLTEISAAELIADTELFGMKMTKWQAYQFALTHAYWTRGQLVPYLRLNGATPPQYRPY